MSVLSSVDRVIVVAVGSSKARAISEAMGGRKTPLGELLRLARSPLVLVDRHAAAELLR
jgi:6-phosphogluconolactonase/glucosamine-6-phosphate isomerase/deaminase